MIIDTLDQSGRYHVLSSRLEQAFAFLKNMPDEVAAQRYDIDGDNVFAMVAGYETSPVETRQYEVHRRYLDVQYIHRGEELVFWKPLAQLTGETMAYDADKEAALYSYDGQGASVVLRAGQFAILHPSDGHIPGPFR